MPGWCNDKRQNFRRGVQEIVKSSGTIQASAEARAASEREAGLIAQILAGRKELFHELIRPYERMVYMTVFSIVRNETDAEDCAQDAVVNAYRHLGKFRGEAKFSTWLATIAMNEGRQRLRRLKRAKEDSLDEPNEGQEQEFTPAPLTDWREIPLEALERKELREALRSAVAELPGIYRQIFTLRDLDELNVAEAAAALGINENMVKVRLHRARMMLQKRLAPYLKDTAPARKSFWRRMPWS
jgi:RNA polymerase sigma-70 factor (ECF subfamily)